MRLSTAMCSLPGASLVKNPQPPLRHNTGWSPQSRWTWCCGEILPYFLQQCEPDSSFVSLPARSLCLLSYTGSQVYQVYQIRSAILGRKWSKEYVVFLRFDLPYLFNMLCYAYTAQVCPWADSQAKPCADEFRLQCLNNNLYEKVRSCLK
jgi:hypothetical protein